MKEMDYQFERLSTRDGFNTAVRHIQAAIEIVERVEDRENLADVLLNLMVEKTITQNQLPAIVSMVLGDKYKYVSATHNLMTPVEDLGAFSATCAAINACDLVLVYHHPDLGYSVVNPKNPEHLAALVNFAKFEFVTVYAGNFAKPAPTICASACEYVIAALDGGKPKADPALLKGDCAYKPPKKKEAAAQKAAKAPSARGKKKADAGTDYSAGYKAPQAFVTKGAPQAAAGTAEPVAAPAPAPVAGSKMTPKYAVLVTNELFHNGNVEAWKKIIASYTAKHPGLEVMVYYDGERITNLNSLFTWGKVKRGTCIEFAVAGENIVDVAKLQRYLKQGASHLFEAFLKGSMNSVLQLF